MSDLHPVQRTLLPMALISTIVANRYLKRIADELLPSYSLWTVGGDRPSQNCRTISTVQPTPTDNNGPEQC